MLDLVFCTSSSNVVGTLLGRGDGTFSAGPTTEAGRSLVNVVLQDFDGDGVLDVAAADYNSTTVWFARGSGDGTFVEGFPLAIDTAGGETIGRFTTADVDGDGRMDLVASVFDTVAVWGNSGGGIFAPVQRFPKGLGSIDVAAGDIDGGGTPDLVTAGNGAVSVLLGAGAGAFAAPRLFVGPTDAAFVVLSDVNGDGRLDVVSADPGGETIISVQLNRRVGSSG